MGANDNMFIIFDSMQSKNKILESDAYNLYNSSIDEKCLYPNKWYTSENDAENFLKYAIKAILSKNVSTYFIYDPVSKHENCISIEILSLTVKYLFQKYYLCDRESGGMLSMKEVNDPKNFIDDGLYCTVIGIQDSIYYDLLHSKCNQFTHFNLEDMMAIQVDSSLTFISFIKQKISEISKSSTVLHFQQFIYMLVYVHKNSNNQFTISTINFIEVKPYFKSNTNEDLATIVDDNEEHFKIVYSKMIDNFNEINPTIMNNKFGALLKLTDESDVIGGRHLFKLLAKIITKHSQADADLEQRNDPIYLKGKLKNYQIKIRNLQKTHENEIYNVERNTRKEVFNQLSLIQTNQTKKQKETFDEILLETEKSYNSKLEYLQKSYDTQLIMLKIKHEETLHNLKPNDFSEEVTKEIISLKEECTELLRDKKILEEQLSESQKRLKDIHNALIGIPNNQDTANKTDSSNSEDQNEELCKLKSEMSVLKELNTNLEKQLNSYKKSCEQAEGKENTIKDLQTRLIEVEQLLNESNDNIVNLKTTIKRQELIIEELNSKLLQIEQICNNEKEEAADTIQQLSDHNMKLQHNLDSMEARHKELFAKYDKLLQKRQEEIDVHKREVISLNQQFLRCNLSPSPLKPNIEMQKSNMSADKNKSNVVQDKKTDVKKAVCRPLKLRSGKELGG